MATLGSGSGSSRGDCLVLRCRGIAAVRGVFGGGRRGDVRGSGKSHRRQLLGLLVGHSHLRLAVVRVHLQLFEGLLLSQAPLVQIHVVLGGYGAVAVGLIEGAKFLEAFLPREEVRWLQ